MRYSIDEIETKLASGEWTDESDVARAAAKTEEEVERAIAEDPEAAGLTPIDWDRTEFVFAAPKTAISIRIDADILDHFKASGPGYQKRINAVLRSYVDHARARRRRRKPDAAE